MAPRPPEREPLDSLTVTTAPRRPTLRARAVLDRLERELAQSLEWTAWQPNGEPLWVAVRQQVTDALLIHWRDGDLVGAKAEEGFFVRCDRTTMTQNDLDNGRLILLVGVALQRPAEFTVFRIARQVGQLAEPTFRRSV